MPVNKNAQFRYQILDRCFSDYRHKYDFDDLLEKVNEHLADVRGRDSMIKERQLRDDINAIRKMLPHGIYLDAKPYYDKKCYYRYSERDFSIFQNELSPDEVQKLRSTIEMLSRYRGVPDNAWLEEVISNLEYRFGIKSNSDNVVAFEQNEQLKGLEYLSEVIDATVNHTPLIIYYKTYKGKELTSTLHPYHIKQYNNRWFLFGYEEESEKIANKALDRIQHISLANVPFKPNTSIDFGHFFDDIVGVSTPYDDVQKETVVLQFTPARFPYVTSKPIHKSQVVIDEEDCTVSLEVKPTRELEQQILSFGPDVEVLSPDTFRAQIGRRIAENYKNIFLYRMNAYIIFNLASELEIKNKTTYRYETIQTIFYDALFSKSVRMKPSGPDSPIKSQLQMINYIRELIQNGYCRKYASIVDKQDDINVTKVCNTCTNRLLINNSYTIV